MRRHRHAVAALGALVVGALPGCTSATIDPVQVGGAVGYSLIDVRLDSDPRGLPAIDPDLAAADGVGGFLEVVAIGSDSDVHLRALGCQGQARVLGTTTKADVLQGMGMWLWSPHVTGLPFTVKPLLGIGLGYIDFDFDPVLAVDDPSGMAAALAGGIEVVPVEHVMVGALAWTSIFGSPGDSEGSTGNVMLYAGVRF